ncbi:MAG: hypothetical protein ACREQM_14830 [Candidatus Dormibacteraceae bacterium]
MRRLLSLALGLTCLLLVAACAGLGGAAGTPASSARTSTPGPRTSDRSVWILPALGLAVHAQPSLQSKRVIVLACGAQIGVVGQEKVAKQEWLHVRSANGKVAGWIVDGPLYVIDRSMSSYSLGGTLHMLYPTTWAVQSGNPAVFTAPAGDPAGGSLRLQSAPDVTALPALPLSAGTEDTGEEASFSVDGIPSEVFVYLTNGGGTEYFIERKLGTLVYLIDLQQPQSTPSTTFFRQLLTSVDAQFPSTPTPSPSPS